MFPVQYSQVCDGLLTIHWAMTPFFMAQWVNSPFLASLLTFLGVFALWALCRVSTRTENPFSLITFIDDTAAMQAELNEQLMLLLRTDVTTVPTLPGLSDDDVMEHNFEPVTLSDFCQAKNLSDPHATHSWARSASSMTQAEMSHKDLLQSQVSAPSNGEPTHLSANPFVRLAEAAPVDRREERKPSMESVAAAAAKKAGGGIAGLGEVRRKIELGMHSLEATAAETIQDVAAMKQDVAEAFEPITSTIFEPRSDKIYNYEVHEMSEFGLCYRKEDVQGIGGADLAKDSQRLPGRSSGDTSRGGSSVPASDSTKQVILL